MSGNWRHLFMPPGPMFCNWRHLFMPWVNFLSRRHPYISLVQYQPRKCQFIPNIYVHILLFRVMLGIEVKKNYAVGGFWSMTGKKSLKRPLTATELYDACRSRPSLHLLKHGPSWPHSHHRHSLPLPSACCHLSPVMATDSGIGTSNELSVVVPGGRRTPSAQGFSCGHGVSEEEALLSPRG